MMPEQTGPHNSYSFSHLGAQFDEIDQEHVDVDVELQIKGFEIVCEHVLAEVADDSKRTVSMEISDNSSTPMFRWRERDWEPNQ
jgi:hypothetical protein